MEEKRRYKRYALNLSEVKGKMISATEVKIIDIGIGGIAFSADRRLDIGSEYALKIENNNRVISLKGCVIWSSLNEAKKGPKGEMIPIYIAGMKFIALTPEKTIELQKFIDVSGEEEVQIPNGRRLNIRFHIKVPEKTILQFPEDYKVINISLGGMLIEYDHVIEVGSKIPMELSFPGAGFIIFPGIIAVCHLTETKSLKKYYIGIEFTVLSDQEKQVLTKFIEYYSAAENKIAYINNNHTEQVANSQRIREQN